MKQIICLAGQPWSSSPGRTQQLLSRLRDTQVLYFSPAAGRRHPCGQKSSHTSTGICESLWFCRLTPAWSAVQRG